MTTTTPSSNNHPAHCGCCHHKINNPEDLIQFKVFRPPADTPIEKLQGICSICGNTGTMAAAIVYQRYSTGKVLREDILCGRCLERFNEKHKYDEIE